MFSGKSPTSVTCLHIREISQCTMIAGVSTAGTPQGTVGKVLPMDDLETDIYLNTTISGRALFDLIGVNLLASGSSYAGSGALY